MGRLATDNRRISLELLGAAAFMVIADARVIDPVLHIIADDFKVGVGSTGVIISAYTIPYGLFQLVYGPLGDRMGKLKVMTAGMGAFAVGTAVCAVAPNLAILTLLRFFTGLAAAAVIPLSLAYIGDNYPYEQRQAAIGRYLGFVVLGQILGSSLGGIFGEYISWRNIFLVFGILSVGITITMWRAIRSIRDIYRSEFTVGLAAFRPYYQLITQPAACTVMIAVFGEGFFLFGGFSYVGAFLRDQYHLPYVAIGFMLSSFGVGGLIYSRYVQWLVRRLGENGMVGVGSLLICVGYLLIALYHNWVLFIPLSIFIGLGFYMMHSTFQTQATELAPKARGTAVALFVFNMFLGQGLGTAAFGRVVDSYGYVPCFVVAALAIALLCFWFIYQKRRIELI
ncbi:MAG: MFS transporter [Rhizonema sp. NSF051]|nr:MFS transporter [Rhizonema sp. NSF051]